MPHGGVGSPRVVWGTVLHRRTKVRFSTLRGLRFGPLLADDEDGGRGGPGEHRIDELQLTDPHVTAVDRALSALVSSRFPMDPTSGSR